MAVNKNLQGVTTTESIDGGWFASRPEFVIVIQLADSPIEVSPLIRCRQIYAKFGATRTQSAENTEKRGEPSTDRTVGELGSNIGLGVAACLGKLRLWQART